MQEKQILELYKEIYEFASSAGALEGYVYPTTERDMGQLDNWIGNLIQQYEELPEEVRASLQVSLDRTIGRAVRSLEPVLGEGHWHIAALRSILKGELPASHRDFDLEKREKAARYGEHSRCDG
jgi:hypothetical protein